MKPAMKKANPGLSKLPTEVRNKMGFMKKGGEAKEDSKMDMVQDKKMAKKAIGMHDKQMHGGKKTDMSALKKGGMCSGGKAKKMAKGGGIEVRGKTKGKVC
jgi:hypothetical protein